jgi:hypothetical protein
MTSAVESVRSGQLSVREASAVYGVPKSTLERHKNKKVLTPGCIGRFKPIMDVDFERELVEYCTQMQNRLFGLTIKDLRTMAYQLAEINDIQNNFNADKKMAGKDWVVGFLRRNTQLSLRTPEPTSIGRAVGFNPVQVGHFYDLLQETYQNQQFHPSHIWNVDEIGLFTVHRPSKVIAKKGQRQIGKITSGERSRTITAVCAFNATGTYVPPMLVYPRVNMNDRLLYGAPPQTIGAASKSGWIDTVLFQKWFDHFVRIAKPTVADPHLLFLDGHISHKSLPLIDSARKNGVTLICFPPHTTHALQPLDCVFYGPLKTYYHQACESFMLHNPGKRITDYDVAAIFNSAYVAAATLDKCVNGFDCTGIYPFNRNKIPDFRYAPSLTTDNSIVDESVGQRSHNVYVQPGSDGLVIFDPPEVGEEVIVEIGLHSDNGGPETPSSTTDRSQVSEPSYLRPSTSGSQAEGQSQVIDPSCLEPSRSTSEAADRPNVHGKIESLQHLTATPTSTKQRICVLDISPYPRCERSERRRNKSQKAEVLTCSPFKKALEEKTSRPKLKSATLKRGRQPSQDTQKKSKKVGKMTDIKTKQGDDMTPCGICKIRFCDDVREANGRKWIICGLCKVWFHNACQGLDEGISRKGLFSCISCDNGQIGLSKRQRRSKP